MTIVNISKAKSQLSKLVKQAERGEEVIIARAGKPVARLIAYTPTNGARRGGQWKGKVSFAQDFDCLPDDISDAFGVL